MRVKIHKPKSDRATRSSLAEKISAELPAPMMALRTRLLMRDIMGRYRCRRSTAAHAVSLARVRAGVERRHGC